MNIAVFCSASDRIAPIYFERARQLGELIARKGHTLVFGGSDFGLMRCVFDAVQAGGGKTIGVVPERFLSEGKEIKGLDTLVTSTDLAERKELMLEMSQKAVILPGGIGTLDELFTALADLTLGYRDAEVIIYNIEGFWNSLLAMLSDLMERGVLRHSFPKLFKVVATPEELEAALD